MSVPAAAPERRLLFSADDVYPILRERRTSFRLPVIFNGAADRPAGYKDAVVEQRDGAWVAAWPQLRAAPVVPVRCPYAVGDRLWVQEPFMDNRRRRIYPADDYFFRADRVISDGDLQRCREHGGTWRDHPKTPLPEECWAGMVWLSAARMPRSAARLFLDVTGCWAHRVCEITHDEATADGACDFPNGCCSRCNGRGRNVTWPSGCPNCGGTGHAHLEKFQARWTKRYGDHPTLRWSANPWVFAFTFRRVQKP